MENKVEFKPRPNHTLLKTYCNHYITFNSFDDRFYVYNFQDNLVNDVASLSLAIKFVDKTTEHTSLANAHIPIIISKEGKLGRDFLKGVVVNGRRGLKCSSKTMPYLYNFWLEKDLQDVNKVELDNLLEEQNTLHSKLVEAQDNLSAINRKLNTILKAPIYTGSPSLKDVNLQRIKEAALFETLIT